MITKMTGVLTRVLDDEARLQVGAVRVPGDGAGGGAAGIIQMRTGQEMTFHVTEYLEGNSGGNRFIPRRIGFITEAELEFFDLFCTVEKIGVKKALKAMARPVKEIADAIAPAGREVAEHAPRASGPTTAEQIVTTLKRKVTKFAMMTHPPNRERLPTARRAEKASREPPDRRRARHSRS